MKKVLSVLLGLALALGLGVNVLASGESSGGAHGPRRLHGRGRRGKAYEQHGHRGL